ncbi:hypothetical protein T492DRAFT_857091, partial [Pavlovales sp. CCMP2436]
MIEMAWGVEACQRLWQCLFSTLGATSPSLQKPTPRAKSAPAQRATSVLHLRTDGLNLTLQDDLRDRVLACLVCTPSLLSDASHGLSLTLTDYDAGTLGLEATTMSVRHMTYAPSEVPSPDDFDFDFSVDLGNSPTTLCYHHDTINLVWEFILFGLLEPFQLAQ